MIPQQALMNNALSLHTPSPFLADADATVTGTDIVSLADLQPQPVEWLWQHRLAAGTLAMLSGKPGSGKTWVALAIAAALTRGRDPFTGEKLKPATVLYASAEHPAAQVIQPRFAGLHLVCAGTISPALSSRMATLTRLLQENEITDEVFTDALRVDAVTRRLLGKTSSDPKTRFASLRQFHVWQSKGQGY